MKAEIKILKGAKRNKSFKINLANYPDFSFIISGENYAAIANDQEFLQSFRKDGDITIGIDREEYQKKILKTKKLNLFDKYIYYRNINIKQVQNRNISFIDLAKVTELRKHNNYAMIVILSLLSLMLLYFMIKNLKIFKKYN